MHRRHTLVALAIAGPIAALSAQREEIIDTYVDGSVRARYEVDAEGRRVGSYLRYHRNGEVALRASYSAGKLHGTWQEYYQDGAAKVSCAYKDDRLHGEHKEQSADGNRTVTTHFAEGVKHGQFLVVEGGKTRTKQVWQQGELAQLDGIAPFPRKVAEIRAEVARILQPPETVAGADQDPKLPDRLAALRRLQAYRYLCGLSYQDMALKPEWNALCDFGAALCKAIGHLDHTPQKPAGMDDESYRKGYEATSHSNLSVGRDMAGSVDSYMNDSDERNIERVGHRRWCLNPGMKFTAFGSAGDFSAMWSFDASGGGAPGLDAVFYPPKGFVPVEFFGPRHAWSISIIRGAQAKAADAKILITELDAIYLPKGEPLALDYLGATDSGAGIGNCLIFRPVGVQVEAGRRYRCEVSLDGGKTIDYVYVVEFV